MGAAGGAAGERVVGWFCASVEVKLGERRERAAGVLLDRRNESIQICLLILLT